MSALSSCIHNATHRNVFSIYTSRRWTSNHPDSTPPPPPGSCTPI
jgi:hypothetical protein